MPGVKSAEEEPPESANKPCAGKLTTLRSELEMTGPSTRRKNAANLRSDKLSDLLRIPEDGGGDVQETRRKVEALEEMERLVKNLRDVRGDDDGALLLEGAREVRRLTKDDSEARTTLALLGAIPPLVGMLDHLRDLPSQIAALYALLNLGIRDDANKAAIVKAGAVHKMLKLIESANGSFHAHVAEAIVANFLALSALDGNKPIIGASGAIPFLISTLKDPDEKYGSQAKQDALRALYNLSISPLNLSPLLDTDLVPFLLSKLGDMDVSERILAILGNIVSMPDGRRAISCAPDAFQTLIDVLGWTDSPSSQEKGSYILMVMAHTAYADRQAMVEAGITSSLLELTLIGTTLAQKRASRILECLTVDKGKHVSGSTDGGISLSPTLSATVCAAAAKSSPCLQDGIHQLEYLEEDDHTLSEERKAVKLLVQQSLQNNMKRIVRRAKLPNDFVPSDNLKWLTSGSASKSSPC